LKLQKSEPQSFSVYEKDSSQTGHCDTSESEPDKLSLARAKAAQSEVLNAVVPPSTMMST